MAARPLKHTWGGKRPGGGRPPSGVVTVQASFRLPPELVAAVQAEAKRRQVTQSAVIADLVREVLVEPQGGGELEAGA